MIYFQFLNVLLHKVIEEPSIHHLYTKKWTFLLETNYKIHPKIDLGTFIHDRFIKGWLVIKWGKREYCYISSLI